MNWYSYEIPSQAQQPAVKQGRQDCSDTVRTSRPHFTRTTPRPVKPPQGHDLISHMHHRALFPKKWRYLLNILKIMPINTPTFSLSNTLYSRCNFWGFSPVLLRWKRKMMDLRLDHSPGSSRAFVSPLPTKDQCSESALRCRGTGTSHSAYFFYTHLLKNSQGRA